MYPALTQSNPAEQYQVEPKFTFNDEKDIQLTNYQNYVLQAQSSKHWKEAEFEGFHLVGQGEYKPYCMKWVSWGCNNTKQHPKGKHYAEHQIKSCKVSHCPKCFESWINRQANRSTKRFSTFAAGKKFNFRHILFSPPQEKAKSMSYPELKKWLAHAMTVANIKTCAVVFHPFRFQDKKKSMPYVSPHFHLIVYGKITNTTEFHNKTGWIIKNKGDLETDVSIFNCIRYLLSHAGVRSKTHTLRYLGDISYRKLKVEKEPNSHVCPYCDLPLTIFHIVKSTKSRPPPIDCVGLWEKNCFREFDPTQNDGHIPFYQKDIDSDTYSEELIYSFEDLLSVETNLPKIIERKAEINQLKYISGFNCQKLSAFC